MENNWFQCILFINDRTGRRISKSEIVTFKTLPLVNEFLIVQCPRAANIKVLVNNVIPVLLETGYCTQHFIMTTIDTSETTIDVDVVVVVENATSSRN